MITWDEYQAAAMRTAWPGITDEYLRLGLIGEVGEVVEVIKKSLRPGATINADRLVDECGDVMWYAAVAAQTHVGSVWAPAWWAETPPASRVRTENLCVSLALDAAHCSGNILGALAHVCPVPLAMAAARNVAKLEARHPHGWGR